MRHRRCSLVCSLNLRLLASADLDSHILLTNGTKAFVSCRFAGETSIASGNAVFVHRNMDLDASDLLSAVDTTIRAARCRATGSTVDHHRAGFTSIPTRTPPGAAPPVQHPAPEAEPGPASEQSMERGEGNVAE